MSQLGEDSVEAGMHVAQVSERKASTQRNMQKVDRTLQRQMEATVAAGDTEYRQALPQFVVSPDRLRDLGGEAREKF